MRHRQLHLCYAASIVLASTPIALADQGPDYSAFKKGTFLSYTNGPPASGTIDAVPKLTISFGSQKTYPIEVDTGSTAIVVSAEQVPSREGTLCDECLEYSSSGKTYSGIWVTLPVTIRGGNDATVMTTDIRVLAVTKRKTCTAQGQCTTTKNPTGIDVMGIGFGREHDHMPDGTPDTNPFLNIADPEGAPMRRGYVVAKTGVHVGLTSANTSGDFHFVKLAQDPQITGEWQAPPACTTVNAPAMASCGTVLIDTGVTSMFLTVLPEAVKGAADSHGALEPGTRLQFDFPGTDGSTAAGYKLVVGKTTDPLAPTLVHLKTKGLPFVNTGVHFLNGFDVLYDADGGYFAYRLRAGARRN